VSKSAKLGQNFLRDERVARRIIELVPEGNGPLLEIGPGQGALSRLLLERFPGRRLVLVEVDRFFAAELQQRFADRAQVVNDDILRLDTPALFAGEAATVVGNLPYHISKLLIDWIITQRRSIAAAVLMLQRDFIDKLLATSGGKKYNAQSVAFQLLFQARRCFDVPANAFVPKPKVVSTVIVAQPLPAALPAVDGFYAFVRTCFVERRKTLANNLSPRHPGPALPAAIAAAGIAPQARAEQLPPERFVALWQALKPLP
jgi:16S rRNA (adenine1518-N6/adenine1519-N6)-dimethyltransferase